MPTISPSAVAQLRARTGVSILACKQALEEANGDEEKAIEILRKRGIAQAVKKAEREQSEGAIFIAKSGSKAAVLTLKCETDFVARSAAFVALGDELAKHYLTAGSDALHKDLEQKLPDAIQKLGENISVGEMMTAEAPVLGTYVHSNRKIGVIIGLEKGQEEMARDVAMHAAALNPLYVHPTDVPGDVLEKEREIWKEQLSKEKKPPEILEKILLGKEKKFCEENALIKQSFVKDSTKSVEQYLNGARITAYVRVSI